MLSISLNSSAPTFAFAAEAASALTCGNANWAHSSDVTAWFTLTLTNAEAKSVSGYKLAGNSTAASITPPGFNKSVGTGPSPGHDNCAPSPSFKPTFPRYLTVTPQYLFT